MGDCLILAYTLYWLGGNSIYEIPDRRDADLDGVRNRSFGLCTCGTATPGSCAQEYNTATAAQTLVQTRCVVGGVPANPCPLRHECLSRGTHVRYPLEHDLHVVLAGRGLGFAIRGLLS
jgi:hypothetical protein